MFPKNLVKPLVCCAPICQMHNEWARMATLHNFDHQTKTMSDPHSLKICLIASARNELTWPCAALRSRVLRLPFARVAKRPCLFSHVSFQNRLMPETINYELVQRPALPLSGTGGSIASRWVLAKRCATGLRRTEVALPPAAAGEKKGCWHQTACN